MNDFTLVRKNLTRNKLRLTLNVFAIIIAFMLFGSLGAINSAFNAGVELAAVDRLVVQNKISFTQTMPVAYVNKIKTVEGVKALTWANWFGGYYQDPRQMAMTFVVAPESYLEVYPEYLLSDEEKQNWFQNRQGIIVGEKLAQQFGWKVGDKIPLSSNIFSQQDGGNTWDVVIEGIFKPEKPQIDTTFALMHHKYFFETQSYGGEWAGWLTLITDSPDLNESVANSIDAMFANSSAETKTGTEADFNKAFIEQIGNINMIIQSVTFAAFFTILLIVFSSMMLAIRERTNEIAVLKTLGFESIRVFKMVLSESMLLSFTGGLLGLGLALLMVLGMQNVPMLSFLSSASLGTDVVLTAIGYMFLMGFLTGIIPSYFAYKLNTIDALSRD